MKKQGDERCRHHLSLLSERGGAVKYRPALFAPRAAAFSFSPRPPSECELNGFDFETRTNHSVIKIMETLREACLTKITGERRLKWKKWINAKSECLNALIMVSV